MDFQKKGLRWGGLEEAVWVSISGFRRSARRSRRDRPTLARNSGLEGGNPLLAPENLPSPIPFSRSAMEGLSACAVGLSKVAYLCRGEGSALERGSRVGFRCRDEGEGKLNVSAMSTRDIRPGLRYLIGVFLRKDWKEINGITIP